MLSRYMFEKVRRLVNEGQNNSQIADKLGINRKTVRKYRESNGPPVSRSRKKRVHQDNFSDFKAQVQGLLKDECLEKEEGTKGYQKKTVRITVSDIFEVISTDGYQGSERTLSRRIKRLKDDWPKERFFEQSYTAGEQSQFDFKESIEIPFKMGLKKINLFFGTLPYSDRFFIKGFTFKKYEAFIDGIHSFFDDVGGQTENIRIDNLSPCVKKVLSGSKRLYTESFLKATDYYGFGVLPCAPGKGNEKGDVERDIRTHARKILSLIKIEGLCFDDIYDFNHWISEYVRDRQKQGSVEKFIHEQTKLTPLPAAEDDILCRIGSARVTSYGTVNVDKSTFSVPDTVIGHEVKTVVSAEEVKIYSLADGVKSLVAEHLRVPSGSHSICIKHIIKSLVRKPGGLTRWKHRDIFFEDINFRRLYQELEKRDADRSTKEFLRIVNLIQHASICEISVAVELALDSSATNLFEEVRSLILGQRYPNTHVYTLKQKTIEPNLQQYDLLIPS